MVRRGACAAGGDSAFVQDGQGPSRCRRRAHGGGGGDSAVHRLCLHRRAAAVLRPLRRRRRGHRRFALGLVPLSQHRPDKRHLHPRSVDSDPVGGHRFGRVPHGGVVDGGDGGRVLHHLRFCRARRAGQLRIAGGAARFHRRCGCAHRCRPAQEPAPARSPAKPSSVALHGRGGGAPGRDPLAEPPARARDACGHGDHLQDGSASSGRPDGPHRCRDPGGGGRGRSAGGGGHRSDSARDAASDLVFPRLDVAGRSGGRPGDGFHGGGGHGAGRSGFHRPRNLPPER